MFTASSSSRNTTPTFLSRRRASSSTSGATSTARATATTAKTRPGSPIVLLLWAACSATGFVFASVLHAASPRGIIKSELYRYFAGRQATLGVFRHVQAPQENHHLTPGPDRPREAGGGNFTKLSMGPDGPCAQISATYRYVRNRYGALVTYFTHRLARRPSRYAKTLHARGFSSALRLCWKC